MIKNSLLKVTVAFLFIITRAFAYSQQTSESFILETKYLLYLPEEYSKDTSLKWPLVIFLHGSGESGEDLAKVKVHGPPKLVDQGKKFPFILVSPQAPPRTGWKVEVLKDMLDNLKKKYRVDPDRIYLTGLSMGGYGTWNFAVEYPDEFAAIAPICGGGNPAEVWKLRHMPVWCFHGAKDNVVPPAASEKMINELRKYNPAARFTLYPEANHNSWDTTYNNDTLYTWLLSQKRFRHKPVRVDETRLKEYSGTYLNEQSQDTIRLEFVNNNLVLKAGGRDISLKASGMKNFYWDDNSIEEMEFSRDKQNRVDGFLLLTGDKIKFRKLASPGKK